MAVSRDVDDASVEAQASTHAGVGSFDFARDDSARDRISVRLPPASPIVQLLELAPALAEALAEALAHALAHALALLLAPEVVPARLMFASSSFQS